MSAAAVMGPAAHHAIRTTPAERSAPGRSPMLQRKCACGRHSRSGECDACGQHRDSPRQQRLAERSTRAAPPIVHEVLRSAGQPLDTPTRKLVEPHLGHDLSAVRVHVDTRAAASAREVDALAYTVGQHIVFGSERYAPRTQAGRHLIAHELTHVVQQRGRPYRPGAELPIASPQTLSEREADLVAGQVARRANNDTARRWGAGRAGASAALHTEPPPSAITRSSGSAVQRYTIYQPRQQFDDRSNGWRHPESKPLMVADTGEMAVEYAPWRSKRAWAKPNMITEANEKLRGQGSTIRLRVGSEEIGGTAPDRTSSDTRTLRGVNVTNAAGGPATLTGDCGWACLEAMGGHVAADFVAVTRPGGVPTRTPSVPYRPGWGVGSNPTTNELSGYIFQMIMREEFGRTLSADEARAAYDRLPDADKERIDRKYGINRYLEPEVGQGLTIGTEFNIPGFRTDEQIKRGRNMLFGGLSGLVAGLFAGGLIAGLAGAGAIGMILGALGGGALLGLIGLAIGASTKASTWNFHFATVILRSGHDYVTIENVARRFPTDWLLMMYGPAEKGQSFHEFQGRTQHGSKYTSMVVE